ncbi:MAG: hypothetical protein U5L95_04380 [Candidatus Saccharibacteria bacterium]|nr:hypothetical protein [Candidatus Saccharibacteria bacterium]
MPKISKKTRLLERILQNLPVIVPVFVAVFGAAMMLLLVLGKFYTWPVIVISGTLAAYVTFRTHTRLDNKFLPGGNREKLLGSLVVIVFVFLWMGFNAGLTAQHLFTNRDPGVYAVTGSWLVEDNDLDIEKQEVFGSTEGVKYNSGGFMPNPDNPSEIHAQGVHLLPSFAGLGGRLFGLQTMFRINVLFGGIALLAIYAFARTIMKPRWAAFAPVIMGASLPMIYFSRDMYTEPLLAGFTFTMLAIIFMAVKTSSRALWFVGGFLGGAGALVRIDGYLTIAMALAFVSIYAAVNARRKHAIISSLLFILGLSLPAIVGWADLSQFSRSYFISEWPNIKLEIALIAAIIVVGTALFVLARKTAVMNKLDKVTAGWRGPAVFILVLLVFGFLASRSLWQVSYAEKTVLTESGQSQIVRQRDYYERSFIWVAWYIGPVIASFGALGLAFFSGLMVKRKDLYLLAPLLVIVSTSIFYIYNPNIHPDHIWAARRFLPVIFPGFVVFGLGFLAYIYNKTIKKFSRQKGFITVVTVSLVLLAIGGPLYAGKRLIFVREATWYSAVQETCNVTHDNNAVLWVGSARTQLIEASKSICDIPTAGYGTLFSNNQMPSKSILAEASLRAREKGYTPLIGLFGREKSLLEPNMQVTKIHEFSYERIEKTADFPRHKQVFTNSILLGEILKDGSIVGLSR